jgi:hypothetical protein
MPRYALMSDSYTAILEKQGPFFYVRQFKQSGKHQVLKKQGLFLLMSDSINTFWKPSSSENVLSSQSKKFTKSRTSHSSWLDTNSL